MAASEELRRPRKKKGSGKVPKEAPFPVPIESLTNKPAHDKRWYYYSGKLRGDKVVVDRFGDMTFLYKMGFFGKGSLSRSDPRFSKFGNTFDDRCRHNFINRGPKTLTEEDRKKREQAFDTMHQERLRQHCLWSEPELNSGKELNCSSHQTEEKIFAEKQDLDNLKHLDTCEDPMQRNPEVLSTSADVAMIEEDEERYSAEDDDMEVLNKRTKLEDPYPITEFLQLTLVEAFFLKFGLGCLTVLDDNEEPLSTTELWNRFRKLKQRFVETYAVYHYFRSKGWVVRDGIVYGSDFLLYKDGMPFYHSSYAVFSYMVEKSEIGITKDSLPWTWQYLTCINRVAEHVAKEVLMCLVVKPNDFNETELNSQRCLSKFEVQELLLRRWVPEKHREAKKDKKS